MSAIAAKLLFKKLGADALLLSQSRAVFGWAMMFAYLVSRKPDRLRIQWRDAYVFGLLGLFGIAGSNFFLYYAFQHMAAALADLIQFTAPLFVALWMWWRGFEKMDLQKALALGLALIGCGLALGVGKGSMASMSGVGVMAALTSMFCYAFLIIMGKHVGSRFAVSTYLHYSLAGAALFWLCVKPGEFVSRLVSDPTLTCMLISFTVLSIIGPYGLFFAGLKRVPASRAGIVGTWEPVFITIGAWLVLGEAFKATQIVGILLVLAAIVLAEISSGDENGALSETSERE